MSSVTAQSLCAAMGIGWNTEPDSELLAGSLATYVASKLNNAIESNGKASLVVSGGSTPAAVFKRLCKADIDWSCVCVTLADERWVPPGHADSNESLVRETLLVEKAAGARFVSLYRSDVDPNDALEAVSRDVLDMSLPFTVTMLGMGGDGHTASLFPDAPADQLSAAMSLKSSETVAIMNPPSVDQTRITLTRSALLNSDNRLLHITGENKQAVLRDALLDSSTDGVMPGQYRPDLKPIVGLLSRIPDKASVFWSP